MATVEGNFGQLKLKESSQKGKGESLPTAKSIRGLNDGKVHRSGEDSTDSAPSSRPLSAPDLLKESVGAVLPPEDQPEEEEKDIKMKESEDSTDAVPSSRPAVEASAVPQPPFPPQQQPCKQEASTRVCSSVAGPGAHCEDGERQEAEAIIVKQAINLEEEKDLILYELADQVAGRCDLRKMALPLRFSEAEVARIEHGKSQLLLQFYEVFQQFHERTTNKELFKRLLDTLVKVNLVSTAAWLRKRLGMGEPEASVAESSPISDAIPQTEAGGRSSNNEFYDIFLMYSGKSDGTKKFQNICNRHNWTVKTSDTMPAAAPVHAAIEHILNTSTHLALIITESDCIKYRNNEMSMTVEMALQLAYTHGTLAGKVLPIRCCHKRSLPLVLQALTGAHIDEDSFEERLVETIDTRTRMSRMTENQH